MSKNKKLVAGIAVLFAAAVIVILVGNANRHVHNLTEVTEIKATCTENGTKAYYKCDGCNAIFADQDGKNKIEAPEEIAAGEHSFGDWEIAVEPTFKTTGTISTTCTVCGEKKTEELPTVSGKNGYKNVSFGPVSAWTYTVDGKDLDIRVETEMELSAFTVEGVDPFSVCSNGSVTDAGTGVQKHNNKYGTFYEHSKGATFTAKITVSEATEAALTIRVSSTDGVSFEHAQAVTAVTLNGGTEGVQVKEGTFTAAGWYTKDAAEITIAVLSLQAGENEVSFTMGTETAKDLNIAGIEFLSELPINIVSNHTVVTDAAVEATCLEPGYTEGSHCELCNEVIKESEEIAPLGHKWNGSVCEVCGAVQEETAEKVYTFKVADNDPFEEGKGSVTDGGNGTGKNTNKYGTFYEHSKGATFTTTITVTEDTEAAFAILVSSTNGVSFEYAQAVTQVLLNGASDGVVIAEGTGTSAGWSTEDAIAINIATLSLKAGKNEVSFTMGTETKKDLNIAAIEFISLIPVELN